MTRILSISAVVLAVLYGLLQLSSANGINASQPFFDSRIVLYLEASNSASVIAISQDEQQVTEAKNRLKQIGAGPIVVVGDERVIWAMSLFSTCMDEPENEKCKDRDLKQLALSLSRAMRISLSEPTNISPPAPN